jgi:hypothetical protein
MSTDTQRNYQTIDPHADKALSWYGWGSPVGFSILLLSVAGSIYLLHLAGLWR